MLDEIFFESLNDGKSLHLRQGPIDLVIGIDGDETGRLAAYRRARLAFQFLLGDLTAEIDILRAPIMPQSQKPQGAIAQKMFAACWPYHENFYITSMAAVAGAVADEMLNIVQAEKFSRAYVNNGGDIAMFLRAGETFAIGICEDTASRTCRYTITLAASDGVGGIATSGWQGRSHSLGIADAVTVLAKTAAQADAAATMIANAVNLENDARITRTPARSLLPDSDLADMPVTIHVAPLDGKSIKIALARGGNLGHSLAEAGLIKTAFLALQGRIKMVGNVMKTDKGQQIG